jgi:MinD-like ATPase involved in chromosome partitioning or flagellar assembly
VTGRPAATRLVRRSGALVDGHRADGFTRLRARTRRLLVTAGEREEAELERRIRALPGPTRPNVVAMVGPTAGVGKTTGAMLLGTLMVTHLKLRVVAVDATGACGMLARVVPERRRCARSLADLLRDAERLHTAAQLRRYVSVLSCGLHVLAGPRADDRAARVGASGYGELIAFLSCFYEVVLLDLAPGLSGPVARLAVERADQLVLVSTPEWLSVRTVRAALAQLPRERTTVMVNRSLLRSTEADGVEQRLRSEYACRAVTLCDDEQLAAMLDTGSYSLEALARTSRVAIKRFGLTVAERLL